MIGVIHICKVEMKVAQWVSVHVADFATDTTLVVLQTVKRRKCRVVISVLTQLPIRVLWSRDTQRSIGCIRGYV